MEKFFTTVGTLIEKQGGHVAAIVLLTWAIKWVLEKYFSKCESAHDDMKEQVSRLADENRAYRILFLKKIGMTDEELRDIVPGYQDDE